MYSSTLSLISVPDGSGWSTPCPGTFSSGKETWYLLYRRLGRPQCWSGWLQKISPPPGFITWTAQPIMSRDWKSRLFDIVCRSASSFVTICQVTTSCFREIDVLCNFLWTCPERRHKMWRIYGVGHIWWYHIYIAGPPPKVKCVSCSKTCLTYSVKPL